MMAKRRNNSSAAARCRQGGSALYIVLIGVVLFGALMYTFARGARQGTHNLSEKEVKLAVYEAMDFVQDVQRGIDRLYTKGCSEVHINFYTPDDVAHTNPNAPGDESCDLFSAAGGAVKYKDIPAGLAAGTKWLFTGTNNVEGSTFGTAAPDLVMIMPDIADEAICAMFNQASGLSGANPAEVLAFDATPYTGAFAAVDEIGSGSGRRGECTVQTTGEMNFFSVLVER